MSEEPKKPKRVTRKRAASTKAETAVKRRSAAEGDKFEKETKPEAQLKPQTEPPKAVVFRRHLMLVKQRIGKGFSLGELKEVGLSVKQALRLKLKVDKRRATVHKWNVEALQHYLSIKAAHS